MNTNVLLHWKNHFVVFLEIIRWLRRWSRERWTTDLCPGRQSVSWCVESVPWTADQERDLRRTGDSVTVTHTAANQTFNLHKETGTWQNRSLEIWFKINVNAFRYMNTSHTSVAAEDLLIDNGSDGQAIKTVCERLPELNVEPAFAWGEKHNKTNQTKNN